MKNSITTKEAFPDRALKNTGSLVADLNQVTRWVEEVLRTKLPTSAVEQVSTFFAEGPGGVLQGMASAPATASVVEGATEGSIVGSSKTTQRNRTFTPGVIRFQGSATKLGGNKVKCESRKACA